MENIGQEPNMIKMGNIIKIANRHWKNKQNWSEFNHPKLAKILYSKSIASIINSGKISEINRKEMYQSKILNIIDIL